MIIKKDTILLLTSGEYSSYGVQTLGKALVDMDMYALKEEFLDSDPTRDRWDVVTFEVFIKWLTVDKKYIEEIPYIEWYLGALHFGDEPMELRGVVE